MSNKLYDHNIVLFLYIRQPFQSFWITLILNNMMIWLYIINRRRRVIQAYLIYIPILTRFYSCLKKSTLLEDNQNLVLSTLGLWFVYVCVWVCHWKDERMTAERTLKIGKMTSVSNFIPIRHLSQLVNF